MGGAKSRGGAHIAMTISVDPFQKGESKSVAAEFLAWRPVRESNPCRRRERDAHCNYL